jgi:MFS transporter, DHA1 family, multidrug resistance protein
LSDAKTPSRLPWRKVVPVSAVMFFSEFAHGGLLLGLLPQYGQEVLGMGLGRVGLCISLYYLSEFCLKVPAGAAVDRLGRRFVLLLAIVASGLTLLGVATVRDVGWFTLLVALHGCSASAIWPAILARIGDAVDEDNRGAAMGALFTAWLAGMGLGAMVMIILARRAASDRFALLSVSWACALVLSAVLVAHAARKARTRVRRVSLHPLRAGRQILGIFGRRWLLVIGLFLQTFCLGLLVPVIERFATTVRQLAEWQVITLLVGGGGLALLLMVPMGKLTDRWSAKRVLVTTLALAGAAVGLFPLVSQFWLLLALVAVAGATYALILPTWNKVLLHHAPEEIRAMTLSAFMAVEQSGIATGPVVSGHLWDWIGPSAPFLAGGGVLLTMSVAYSFTRAGYLSGAPAEGEVGE